MFGSRILKAMSVLWIVFGVVSVIIMGYEMVSMIYMKMTAGSFVVPLVMGLMWAAAQLAAGVVGLKYWNQPAKAKLCLILAGVIVLTCLIFNGCMLAYGYPLLPYLSIPACLGVTAVYVRGAMYNRKLDA